MSVVETSDASGATFASEQFSGELEALSPSLAYDSANDRLYAAYDWGVIEAPKLVIFDHASSAGALARPSETIALPGLVGTLNLQLDRSRDILYIGAITKTTTTATSRELIAVLTDASKATSTSLPKIYYTSTGDRGIALDPQRQLLYAINGIVGSLAIFDLTKLTDPSAFYYDLFRADRVIHIPNINTTAGIAIDATRDRFYAVNNEPTFPYRPALLVIDGASTASPRISRAYIDAISPDHPRYISIDETNDRLYLGYVNVAATIANASSLGQDEASAPALWTFNVRAVRDTYVGGFAFP